MGQSSSNSSQASLPAFKHGVVLQGLPGSGVSTVQSLLNLKEDKFLTLDQRFLSNPPLLPAYGFGGWNPKDKHLFRYGGRGSSGARWRSQNYAMKGIIFVVDASDESSLPLAINLAEVADAKNSWALQQEYSKATEEKRKEMEHEYVDTMTSKALLKQLLAVADGHRKPVLILANKQDKEGSISPNDVAERLGVAKLFENYKNEWRVQGISALTGEGLLAGMQWLNDAILAQENKEKKEEEERRSKIALNKKPPTIPTTPTTLTTKLVPTPPTTPAPAQPPRKSLLGEILSRKPSKTDATKPIATPKQQTPEPGQQIEGQRETSPSAETNDSPLSSGASTPTSVPLKKKQAGFESDIAELVEAALIGMQADKKAEEAQAQSKKKVETKRMMTFKKMAAPQAN